jgi:hypothetical protein
MHDRPTTEPDEVPRRTQSRPGGKGMLWGLLAVVIAFLIGFFWQFYQATTVRATLAATEQELVLERMRVQLTGAALAAQGGRYEEARTEMSSFFNRIQTQRWALPDRLRTVADEFLAMRDDIITGLSRANPDTAATLFGMLQRFEEAMPDADPLARPGDQPHDPADPAATTRDPPPGNAEPRGPAGDHDPGR